MITLCALTERYLDQLRVQRNLAANTLESYGRDLRALQRALLDLGVVDVVDVTEAHLRGYLGAMARAQAAPASQRRALSSLRQLFLFAQRERIITQSPARDLEAPTVPRVLPRVPGVAQASAMLDALATLTDPEARRDCAAIELLYGAGLRASELCGLRFDDIDLALALVRPRGKGNKERLVPVGEPAVAALRAYLQAGRPQLLHGATHDVVFVTNRGRALTRVALFKIVKRRAADAGLDPSVSPHTLRHAFATHLVHGGADLRSVQEMLGHASIATTEIYTHVGAQALRRTIDAHHPLAAPESARAQSVQAAQETLCPPTS